MKKLLRSTFTLAGISLLATTASLAPASATPDAPATPPIEATSAQSPADAPQDKEVATQNLSAEDRERVISGEPVVINVDTETGIVQSVEDFPMEASFITEQSNCSNVQGCFYGAGVPYADIGFLSFGGGTATGNWPQREAFGSQTFSTSACTTLTCYLQTAPGQLVVLSTPATGTSFTIY